MRKIIVTVLIGLLFLFIVSGCGSGPKAPGRDKDRYFRILDMNGGFSFFGRFPVVKKTAKDINCYWFDFDSDGRPSRIEFRRQGILAIDDVFHFAFMKIAYTDSSEIRTNYNVEKQVTGYIQEYIYNEAGHRVRLKNLNQSGTLVLDSKRVAQYEFITDAGGRRTEAYRLNLKGRRIADRMGVYLRKTEYNTKGQIDRIMNYSSVNNLMRDASGLSYIHWIYDEAGNRIQEIGYNVAGEIAEDTRGIAIRKYVYDAWGSKIKVSFFNKVGLPVGDHQRIAVYHWDYNRRGEANRLRGYDIEGKVIYNKALGADKEK